MQTREKVVTWGGEGDPLGFGHILLQIVKYSVEIGIFKCFVEFKEMDMIPYNSIQQKIFQ